MTQPDTKTYRLRVTSIRSRKPGGILFAGCPLLDDGTQDNRCYIVVKALGSEARGIEVGELWEVTGSERTQTIKVNGYTKKESLLAADRLCLLKPSGSQIVQWIADHKAIQRIGQVKAQKLWEALGEGLYDALDRGDADPILDVLPNRASADSLLAAWAKDGDTKTLRWMQAHRIPLELARKVIRVHGRGTLQAMREDPYRLLSFTASWERVDAIAHDLLGIENDDPRRLRAAVEEAIYAELDKGHTLCVSATLKRPVTKLLSSPELAARALALARDNNSIVVHEGRYQSAGAWIMERAVAEFVSAGIHQPRQSPLFGGDPDELIDRFEQQEAAVLGVAGFRLNAAQRTAIKRSFAHGFSVITGGAGTGKTTALNALYALLDTTGLPRFQMALSGRAAKRMREATGERAYTIAGFLKNVSTEAMGPAPILILDEASMVDLATMYRLIRRLPAQCRMVLVGDPYQLPPIGSGLVLHCLTRLDAVPVSELTEVKRQSADSAIPAFAKAIRNGVWPEAPSPDITADVAVVPCEDTQLIDAALALYEIDRENTQILCATRANPYSGFKTISGACCYRYTAGEGAAPLRAFGQATGFYEGDLLLYTRNDWDRNLQNGLLGRLVEAFPEPRRVNVTEGDVEAIGWVEWEGRRTPLLESDVEWLEHGYAISIHKSQGSQFKRVIVPITRGRLLDRTLVYTAVTRAQHQVILVGDVAAIRQAVTAPPAAHLRRIALSTMLERALHQVGGLAARQTQPQ